MACSRTGIRCPRPGSSLISAHVRALDHPAAGVHGRSLSVLVIGFGVGNTTHRAATLHPTVRPRRGRRTITEISWPTPVVFQRRQPRCAERSSSGRVRQRRTAPPARCNPGRRYDLDWLEPPPIAHAGVAALLLQGVLQQLGRGRDSAPHGYVNNVLLPAYQVPPATALAMSVACLPTSSRQSSCYRVGRLTDARQLRRDERPADRDDPASRGRCPQRSVCLRTSRSAATLIMGTVREIMSARLSDRRTRSSRPPETPPVTDDWPSQEYSVNSPFTLA